MDRRAWRATVHRVSKELDTTEATYHTRHLCLNLVPQAVKNLPAMQETRVQSLGQEGPMVKGMIIHSSILGNSTDRGAWRAIVDGVA